ncbi:hypothetical protein OAM69_02770 [bacterium]|nr:hypothetical protein [bacterium]
MQEYRRSGSDAALVKYAIDSLKDMGCIKVNLQIRSTNTGVAAFYKSLFSQAPMQRNDESEN